MSSDASAAKRIHVARLEKGLFSDSDTASSGLEIGDPRLNDITDAAFKGNYAEAAALAQQVWDEDVRDVRLIGYLLYGHFLEKNVAGLAWQFAQLTAGLTTRWDGIGPAKKDKPADGALNWLFQQQLTKLQGHEKLKDDVHKSWLGDQGVEQFAAAAKASAELLAAVEARFPTGKALDKLRNLSGWISDQERLVRQIADGKKVAEDNAAQAQADAEAQAQAKTAAAAAASAPGPNGPPAKAGAIYVEGGAPMALLMRKIELFQKLIDAKDLNKAAVVARDVDQLVQNFDPIAFLPKLLVPFFRLMSRNMERLEPAMAALDMPSSKSLVQLYHADLDAFAES
jgi:hypothetical protein